MTDKYTKWRKDIRELSDEDLIDELNRPTAVWGQDVIREALARILFKLKEQDDGKED